MIICLKTMKKIMTQIQKMQLKIWKIWEIETIGTSKKFDSAGFNNK